MHRSTRRIHAGAWRWLIVIVGIVGVIILAANLALRYFVNDDYLEKRLAQAVRASTDSLYQVRLEAVSFSLLHRSLDFRDVTFRPDSVVLRRRLASGSLPGVRYAVTVSSIHLDGVALASLIRRNRLKLRTLSIRRPRVHVTVDETRKDSPEQDASSGDAVRARTLHEQIAHQLPALDIGRVAIERASISWEIRGGGERQGDVLEGINLLLDDVVIDTSAARDTSRVLFSRDVQFRMSKYRHVSADSLYALEVGTVRGSSKAASLDVASIRWAPTVSDADFLRRHTYRANRYKFKAGTISLLGLDYRRLLDQEGIFIASVQADTPSVDVSYDRTLPPRPRTAPAELPHETFQSITMPVRIDTIRIRRGNIRYAERAEDGTRPGVIEFESVWGTVYNVTNDSSRMTPSTPALIDARAMVAGAGELEAEITYELLSDRLDMQYHGTVGSMDARAFNTVFVDLEGIRITSGRIDSVWFDIKVKDGLAAGPLQMIYRNLEIEALDKKTREQNVGDRLKTFIANKYVINGENVPHDGNPATVAVIHHERTPDDPIFKFIWETLRSGLFSTIGA